jgi:hypothetical protein
MADSVRMRRTIKMRVASFDVSCQPAPTGFAKEFLGAVHVMHLV